MKTKNETNKFRPHWLLDTGDKIYIDELSNPKKTVYCISEWLDNWIAKHYELTNEIIYNGYVGYAPFQTLKNAKTDFNILFCNGIIIKAKWIGAKNECT